MRNDERKSRTAREREIAHEEAHAVADRTAVTPADRPMPPPADSPAPPPAERLAPPPVDPVRPEGRPVGAQVGEAAHDLLFPSDETTGYRSRWEAVQAGFVDEPRAAVEQADALVEQVASRLVEVFTRERQSLEQQWGKGENVSTEDLRVALKRYRNFFDRLLSV